MKLASFTALWAALVIALTEAAPATLASDDQVQPISYAGYQVVRIKATNRLSEIESKLSSAGVTYNEWHRDFQNLDIVIAPSEIDAFKGLHLDFTVMHSDLGSSITAETQHSAKWKRQGGGGVDDESWFDAYHNYEDHIQYFKTLQSQFPNNSAIISSGKSVQGRDLYGLHLWGKDGPSKKPAVLYHGTVHAREWIAAPTVEFITRELIRNYKAGDGEITGVLDKYDFYIIPIVNPDGFVYTQVADRLWRKNRQPARASTPNQTCIGTDINRNWEFGWDATPRGASTNPCSATYRGEAPSDTPENQGLDKFLRKIRDTQGIKLYIDWHSYGQYILSPFGSKETLYAPELGKWTKAAAVVSETIRDATPDGRTYVFGPSGATLYATTGAAPDHAYSVGRAEFSYTIELRDIGDFGFVLPASQIRNTAKENWEGQKVLWSLLDETFFDGVGPAMIYQAIV